MTKGIKKKTESQKSQKEILCIIKKALPFFGHTELLRLKDTFRVIGCDLSERALDAFFKDIVEVYNQEEVKKIWEEV